MPHVIRGGLTGTGMSHVNLNNVNYDYDYPEGVNLKPGSKEHDRIRDRILDRARESYDKISQKHSSWQQIDRTLTTYITPEDVDEKKDKFKTNPIIVPVSYATLETLLTYLTAAFIQNPIFRYEGQGPEDVGGCALLELLINKHITRFGVGLNLHTAWRDNFAYGFGAVSPYWDELWGTKTVIKEEGFFSNILGKFAPTGISRDNTEESLLFEGNNVRNIDPYSYLPDPNIAAHDVQKGEFVGWIEKENIMTLLSKEKRGDGDIFNVKYLQHLSDGLCRTVTTSAEKSARQRDVSDTPSSNTTRPIEYIRMYVTIIPKDWKVGSGEYPEKWMFTVASDEVVIEARSLGLDHNQYPVAVASSDYDGYSTSPISKLETIYPLQETSDWLFSSHIANVRKAINDMMIVDPSVINIFDLKSPRPGKTIRLRKAFWGRGLIDQGVKQLQVNDVTSGHLRDVSFISDLISKSSGATDILQGIMRTGGERRSATEARDARTSALSKLEKTAKIIGLQLMQPLARMFASHTQQLMSQDTYAKVIGDWDDNIKTELGVQGDRVKISPLDINVDYDVIPHDGSMPGGEPVDLWVQLLQVFAGSPEISQTLDMSRIFKHVARQMGAKNVEDFIKKPTQVMPDEGVQQEVDKGNLIPMPQEGMGGM